MSRPIRWLATFAAFLEHFPEFLADSWRGWRSIGAVLFGEPPEDLAFIQRITARTTLPPIVRALFAIFGRGSGKSRFVSLLIVYFSVGRQWHVAAGENIYIMLFAPTRRQAHISYRYVLGLLKSVPSFAAMICRETAEEIELDNGVIIEIGVADGRKPRGRSIAVAFVDEGAFLPTDDSATPDTELLRALRPALARVPGSLLVFVSSPYAQRGELFKAFQQHYGKDDSDTLVVKGATRDLNPTFDERAIAEAFTDDPASAESEYAANFRTDVQELFSRDVLEARVVAGRLELSQQPGTTYKAFLDFAGGSGTDSATLAIAHLDPSTDRAVLDLVREVRPPFSPEQTCAEFATSIRAYTSEGVADRWGGQFPVEAMQKLGIRVKVSERTKSDLYRELLPLVNSGRVELLDHPRLIAQLANLERRTARGGKDSIDHGPGGTAHDDLANAVAGALVLAAAGHPQAFHLWGAGDHLAAVPRPEADEVRDVLAWSRGEDVW
jgi:hypothetical protein